MSSLIKSFVRSLGLVPIALTVHIGVAAAANSGNDRADEQRAWLSGRSATVSTLKGAPGRPKAPRLFSDAQEQARNLVLAIPAGIPAARQPDSARSGGNRARADAQLQAQRVVLGRSALPEAGA
jgi:hypothetical protein